MKRAAPPEDSSPAAARGPAVSMGMLVWLSLIPVAVVVLLWVYSGWQELSHDFRRGQHGTTLRSVLGVIQVIRWTRNGPSSPMVTEIVKSEWNVAGLGDQDLATTDGNSTRKVFSIPFWLILTVVAVLPIITVARAQRRANRGRELSVTI